MERYVLGFLGLIIYNLYLIERVREKYDLNKDGYSLEEIGVWFRVNWIGFVISTLLTVVVIYFDYMPDLWNALIGIFTDKYVPFIEPYYLIAGALSCLVEFFIQKLVKK